METHKGLLNVGVWILWVAGVLCIAIGMYLFMTGKPALDFAVHGLGGAYFILLSSVVAYLRRKL